MHDAPAPLRLTDVLTTAAAVSDYVGADEVAAGHVREALAQLTGDRTMDDLGRGRSPLVPRRPGGAPATPAVRALAQRWFAELGSNVAATFDDAQLAAFRLEVDQLAESLPATGPPPD